MDTLWFVGGILLGAAVATLFMGLAAMARETNRRYPHFKKKCPPMGHEWVELVPGHSRCNACGRGK